ncbi:GxxExxY protein [Holophaga foetida]|uniref:GxxExxY protein n=1 Tax=Holophaga foetida TaxID=35839 RepID=UPI000247427C|nr:GxxExxY protein [Holophaga foetida]
MESEFHHEGTKATKETPRKALGEREEWLSGQVVDAAVKVHRHLGPGLLESVYEQCLIRELELRQIPVQTQVTVPIAYEGLRLDSGLRLDLLVDNLVILELKAVEQILPVHEAQLMSYLKLSGKRLGLLLNFNVPLMRDGIRRKAL